MTPAELKRMGNMKAEIRRMKKFKRQADARKKIIERLTRELAAEKRLTNALSRLAYAPADRQKPGVLKEVKRAAAMRQKMTERRRAA